MLQHSVRQMKRSNRLLLQKESLGLGIDWERVEFYRRWSRSVPKIPRHKVGDQALMLFLIRVVVDMLVVFRRNRHRHRAEHRHQHRPSHREINRGPSGQQAAEKLHGKGGYPATLTRPPAKRKSLAFKSR